MSEFVGRWDEKRLRGLEVSMGIANRHDGIRRIGLNGKRCQACLSSSERA